VFERFTDGARRVVVLARTVTIFGRPRPHILEGRMVVVDGEWKVSRTTMGEAFARAGVGCPPPEDPA
jgi:hypothetical protein